jgi:rRNA-processing protein FCF1
MEVILDTNFIVSCIVKKIDFLEELRNLGFTPILPREVVEELKDLKTDKKASRDERTAVDVAFEMLDNGNLKKIKLGGKTVDEGLIKKGNDGAYIATLDKVIKREVPNRVVISNAQNGLCVERD